MTLKRFLHLALSGSAIEKTEARIVDDAKAGRHDAAWTGLQSLLHAQANQESAARAVIRIVEAGHFPPEKALEALTAVYGAYPRNESLLGPLGEALEQARDIDFLNAAPSDDPLYANVASALAELAAESRGRATETSLLRGLFTATRMMSRQRDELAESSGRRLIELDPDNSTHHYNLGLLFKTRGRFREGVEANRAAAKLIDASPESYEWNLGICATGAGDAALALEVWKRLGQKIEMGRFGLPDGSYPQCKVQLAERPLAERTAQSDDPGLEETIWIERLSPCHGIIRSVLYQPLGVDYGDAILFDGAPVTYHTYGDREVPVFPHLATLVRSGYQFFDFAGTQEEAGQIAEASADFEQDAIVYSHSESFVFLCAACWRDRKIDHTHEEKEKKHVVTGRIAAPPELAASDLLRQLDRAIEKRAPCRIYVPNLCEAAGFSDRAAVERRRFQMIAG